MEESAPAAGDNLPQMPLEGHYQARQHAAAQAHRARAQRARRGHLLTCAAILALILATAGDSRPGPAAGCVSAVVAGRVGGEPVNGCGEEAKAICARSANYDNPRARTINEQVRRGRGWS